MKINKVAKAANNTASKNLPKSKTMCVIKTDGKGLWSDVAKGVKITDFFVCNEFDGFGELMVEFNPSSWNVEKHGLIYTDKTWLSDFRMFLITKKGFSKQAVDDIDYSEQGMQGDVYVSLDCGRVFLREYHAKKKRKKGIVK